MGNRVPFGIGEWYHCYNRGVDKRRVFKNSTDYERFLALLYLCNGKKAVHLSNLKDQGLAGVLSLPTVDDNDRLVSLGAYCLMPNHVHFMVKELCDGGIASFMQKVFTGYTMYFNKKNNRTGALFAGVFKSKHVAEDRYAKHLVSYIHLNPVHLFESDWKNGKGDVRAIERYLHSYPHSSLLDFAGTQRPQEKIISLDARSLFEKLPTTQDMLKDAREYLSTISR